MNWEHPECLFLYSEFTLGGIQGKPKPQTWISLKIAEKSPIELLYLWRCYFIIALKCLYRMKCPLAGTNKRFLINTIKNTLPSQKDQDQDQEHEHEQEDDRKQPEPSESRKEEKPKKHRTYPYTPSFQARRRVSYSPPRYRSRNRHTRDKYEKWPSKQWEGEEYVLW